MNEMKVRIAMLITFLFLALTASLHLVQALSVNNQAKGPIQGVTLLQPAEGVQRVQGSTTPVQSRFDDRNLQGSNY